MVYIAGGLGLAALLVAGVALAITAVIVNDLADSEWDCYEVTE